MLRRQGDAERSFASITEADAARWALEFATASFGDALLASAVALLLLPQMPQGVQVRSLSSICALLLCGYIQQECEGWRGLKTYWTPIQAHLVLVSLKSMLPAGALTPCQTEARHVGCRW